MNNSGVIRISPGLNRVNPPSMLKPMSCWIIWHYEQVAGESKPRKIPVYANGSRRHGVQGSPEDRSQLVTFEVAQKAAARMGAAGIGFCMLPELGLVVLDFDGCVTDGVIHPDVLKVTNGTYAEFSPSGTGIHAFYRGSGLGNLKDPHGEPFGVEVFENRGFLTFTNQVTDETELTACEDYIAPVTPQVLALCHARFGPDRKKTEGEGELIDFNSKTGTTLAQAAGFLAQLDPDMGRQPWFSVACGLHYEFDGSEDAFTLFDSWSAGSPKYGVGQTTRAVWESLHTDRPNTIGMPTIIKMAREAQAKQPVEVEPAVGDNLYKLVTVSEMMQRPPVGWIIKKVLPKKSMGMMYGASGSGKSFAALDMALAVSQGHLWNGHKTNACPVVYVAAEGQGGFTLRMQAYCQDTGIDPATLDNTFRFITAAPDLGDLQEVSRVAKSIKAFKPGLIFIDTMSQTTHGLDENTKEIEPFLVHMQKLGDALGASTMTLHHSGKSADKGARGWSGIRAAMDYELEVMKAEDDTTRSIRVTKQKDGADGAVFFFKLKTLEIGLDEDLDVIESCVVEYVEPPATVVEKEVRTMKGLVLVTYNHVCGLGQTTGIEIDAVVAEISAGIIKPEGRDTRKQQVRRALNVLVEDGYFRVVDGCIEINHAGEDRL